MLKQTLHQEKLVKGSITEVHAVHSTKGQCEIIGFYKAETLPLRSNGVKAYRAISTSDRGLSLEGSQDRNC